MDHGIDGPAAQVFRHWLRFHDLDAFRAMERHYRLLAIKCDIDFIAIVIDGIAILEIALAKRHD